MVWDGERPEPDAAGDRYTELMEAYEEQLDDDALQGPTPALDKFLTAVVQRLPDDPEIAPSHSPWAFTPVRDEAQGPIVILHVRWDQVDKVLEVVPPLAHKHGLVCYDPQEDALL